MEEKPLLTPEQLDAYLERIEYAGSREPSVDVLDALLFAQLTHVPFENLDVYEFDLVPDLSVDALFDKIVVRRRGGYCFELNGLFTALLRTLGFSCDAVYAYMTGSEESPEPPALHRGIVVDIDGGRRFCDVGFGGPSPASSVPIDGQLHQTPTGAFHVIAEGKWHILERVKGDEVIRTHIFDDHPYQERDFKTPNFYCARSEGIIFRQMRLANILTPTGSIGMEGDALRIRENGVLTERTIEGDADRDEVLKKYFGIVR